MLNGLSLLKKCDCPGRLFGWFDIAESCSSTGEKNYRKESLGFIDIPRMVSWTSTLIEREA